MDWTKLIFLFLLTLLLSIAVITDLRYRKIPNRLTFPAILAGLVFHTVRDGFAGCLFSLEGIGLGMALLMIPYLLKGMGAGDVKLLGAVGGFLGPQGVFWAFLFIGIVGGLYALWVLLFQRTGKEIAGRYGRILKALIFTRHFIYIPSSPAEGKPQLMYGLAIALGTFLSLGVGNQAFLKSVF